MGDDIRERGFTTAILHGDRAAAVEHGAVHKPLHPSVAYGYRDTAGLIAVFQGRETGHAYGREGNPTTAALEAKVTAMEGGSPPSASPPAWPPSARSCWRCSRAVIT